MNYYALWSLQTSMTNPSSTKFGQGQTDQINEYPTKFDDNR